MSPMQVNAEGLSDEGGREDEACASWTSSTLFQTVNMQGGNAVKTKGSELLGQQAHGLSGQKRGLDGESGVSAVSQGPST